MFFQKNRPAPLVSVCIPVHNTEKYLVRCLDSVAEQGFDSLELVLINDRSSGRDGLGRNCKKIVRDFKKKTKIPVVYIEHSLAIPLLETRRELVECSHGEYILMVDSDDFLAEGAVRKLYDAAKSSGADITCAQERVYKITGGMPQISERPFSCFSDGRICGREILDSWLVESRTSAFLWAKLIRRELYLKAFDSIPYMECSLSVDTPIYFFLAWHASSYYGINDVAYYYLENEGITSNKKVTDIETWRRQCTVSSIYTLLLTFEGGLTEEEKEALRKMSRQFMYGAILRLQHNLEPSLYDEARAMLCDYWGKDYVELVESAIKS